MAAAVADMAVVATAAVMAIDYLLLNLCIASEPEG